MLGPPTIGHNLQTPSTRSRRPTAFQQGDPHRSRTTREPGARRCGEVAGRARRDQGLRPGDGPARARRTFETHAPMGRAERRQAQHTPKQSSLPDQQLIWSNNLPRWAPYDSFNLNEDVPGSIAAPAKAMAYPWKHFIGGHMGRFGTRHDMVLYQRYVDDIIAGVKKALVTVDPTPFFAKYGNNSWAAVKAYQAAQVDYAAAPVIKKYTGVLAAADVYTASTTFIILESIRLDLGVDSQPPVTGCR